MELAHAATAVVVVVHLDAFWQTAANPARLLAHAAALRVAYTPVDPVMHASGDVLGLWLRAEVVKNQIAAPYGTAEFEMWHHRGVHAAAELIDLGLADGLLRTGPDAISYR